MRMAGVGGICRMDLAKSKSAGNFGRGGLGAAGREAPLLPVPGADEEAAGREAPLLPTSDAGSGAGLGMGKNLLLVDGLVDEVARAGDGGGGALAGSGARGAVAGTGMGAALDGNGGKSSAANREVSLLGSAPSHAAPECGAAVCTGAPGKPGGGGFTRIPAISLAFGGGAASVGPTSTSRPEGGAADAIPARNCCGGPSSLVGGGFGGVLGAGAAAAVREAPLQLLLPAGAGAAAEREVPLPAPSP